MLDERERERDGKISHGVIELITRKHAYTLKGWKNYYKLVSQQITTVNEGLQCLKTEKAKPPHLISSCQETFRPS